MVVNKENVAVGKFLIAYLYISLLLAVILVLEVIFAAVIICDASHVIRETGSQRCI
jgi:hypothetical protein